MEAPDRLNFMRLAEEMFQAELAKYNAWLRNPEAVEEVPDVKEELVEVEEIPEKKAFTGSVSSANKSGIL